MKINNQFVAETKTKLDLSGRDIWFLNPNIKGMFRLKELYLQNNSLPDEIQQLIGLEIIDIRNNRIREAPEILLEMEWLKEIRFYGNPFYSEEVKHEFQAKMPTTAVI